MQRRCDGPVKTDRCSTTMCRHKRRRGPPGSMGSGCRGVTLRAPKGRRERYDLADGDLSGVTTGAVCCRGAEGPEPGSELERARPRWGRSGVGLWAGAILSLCNTRAKNGLDGCKRSRRSSRRCGLNRKKSGTTGCRGGSVSDLFGAAAPVAGAWGDCIFAFGPFISVRAPPAPSWRLAVALVRAVREFPVLDAVLRLCKMGAAPFARLL